MRRAVNVEAATPAVTVLWHRREERVAGGREGTETRLYGCAPIARDESRIVQSIEVVDVDVDADVVVVVVDGLAG